MNAIIIERQVQSGSPEPVHAVPELVRAKTCKKGVPQGKPRALGGWPADPVDVVRAFNTWAYKRQQPDRPDIMMHRVANAMAAQDPVEFVLYWGKGPRDHQDVNEVHCLEYLRSMGERISQVYEPGVLFTLLLTDTHARLNGHAEHRIDRYFGEMNTLAASRGFATRRLSHVVQEAVLQGCTAAEAPMHLAAKLESTAAKWYRGEGGATTGAAKYLEMNMLEKEAVELIYPNAIFVTFNGGELRELFPKEMPIFYMYSLRRGFSVKPWFIDAASCEPRESPSGAIL